MQSLHPGQWPGGQDLQRRDDIWPSQHFYRRSDHYHFARKDVPILFFFNGTHPQYHRADDEVQLINTSKLVIVAEQQVLPVVVKQP